MFRFHWLRKWARFAIHVAGGARSFGRESVERFSTFAGVVRPPVLAQAAPSTSAASSGIQVRAIRQIRCVMDPTDLQAHHSKPGFASSRGRYSMRRQRAQGRPRGEILWISPAFLCQNRTDERFGCEKLQSRVSRSNASSTLLLGSQWESALRDGAQL